MNTLRLCPARDDRRGRRGRGRAGRGLSGRRHQPARPDEGRHRAAPPPRRRHAPAGARPDRASAGWRRAHRRAGAQCRSGARRRISRGAFPRWRRRCCPAPRRSFAMPRRSAAICCSARAARISTTPPAPATNATPGAGCDARGGENAAARRAGLERALHRHPPVGFLRAAGRARRRGRDRGPDRPARGPAGRPSIVCPATRRERESVLEPGELIVAVRLPAEAARFRRPCALPEGSRAHVLCLRRRVGRRGAAASKAARSREARLALGGVAAEALARPRGGGRCWPARTPDAAAFRRAAEAALADAKPSGDNAFKIELARRIVGARARARRGGNARAHAGAAGLSLRRRSRSVAHA